MLIQGGTIKKICPNLHTARCAQIESVINKVCPLYGISTAGVLHEFLANVLLESDCFRRYEENMNYSYEALVKKFSRARISTEDALRYGRSSAHPANPKEIANHIYGGEWGKNNLGNTEAGDGWLLRGSGPIQLTGRDMMMHFSQYMLKMHGVNNSIDQWAQILRTSDEYGMHSACWFFSIAKNLIPLAQTDQMKEIVKRINGGLNALDERMKYYELCKQYIV